MSSHFILNREQRSAPADHATLAKPNLFRPRPDQIFVDYNTRETEPFGNHRADFCGPHRNEILMVQDRLLARPTILTIL